MVALLCLVCRTFLPHQGNPPHARTSNTLCRLLPLDALLTVLNAALLERSIVFFHPVPALLSACVLGVLPMLRPFSWQCVILPVVPASELSILDAPVPFLLGCQYKTADVASR